MIEVTSTELRENLSLYIHRVGYDKEKVQVTYHGNPIAQIVPNEYANERAFLQGMKDYTEGVHYFTGCPFDKPELTHHWREGWKTRKGTATSS